MIVWNTYNNPIKGVIALYDNSGSLISDVVFDTYEETVFHDITTMDNLSYFTDFFNSNSVSYETSDFSENLFCAIGGIKQNNVFYPYIAFISLDNNAIKKGLPTIYLNVQDFIINNRPNVILNEFTIGGGNSQGNGYDFWETEDPCNISDYHSYGLNNNIE